MGIYWSFLDAGGKAANLFVSIAVILASLYFYLRGEISLGSIILFIAASSRLTGPFLQLESSYRNIVRYCADYHKYREVLVAAKEPDEGKKEFSKIQTSMRLENISFTYPGTAREVLKDVRIDIKPGQKTALVGHTGSGKSTLSNLLVRFYEPTTGSITVDGTDIREFTLDSYRTKFAAVFQDTTLFNASLRYNLAYVRDGLTEEEIRSACRDANILDFIESLPDGFDTVVGERGLKLSGGEKQRIAIARAILADPEILILDEATSALDSTTERLVSQALARLMKGRTSVIIAHRLSTIRHSDRIYLLDQGKVIGSGSHEELYASSAVYQEMVDYQKDGFVE